YRAAYEVRAGDQSQDREGAGPHDSAVGAGAGGRGYPMRVSRLAGLPGRGRPPRASRRFVVGAGAGIGLALAPLAAPLVPASDPAATLVVAGGTLIDGTGGVPLRDAVIVIEGTKIVGVAGPGAGELPGGDVRRLDARGRFVIPGLIDAHVHHHAWMGTDFL